MEVIHSIWDTTNLHIWAESSDLFRNINLDIFEITTNEPKHPFVASFSRLYQILKNISQKIQYESFNLEWLVMKLPSYHSIPQPSPLLEKTDKFLNQSFELLHWQINSLSLKPINAIEMLLSIPSLPPTGIVFSDSLIFWKMVAEFTLNLIKKGSYIPFLKILERNSEMTKFIAKWQPIILGHDRVIFEKISQSMPDYCLAFNQLNTQYDEIVRSFIDQTIDQFLKNKINAFIPHQKMKDDFSAIIAKDWFESLYDANNEVIISKTNEFDYFYGILKSWLRDFDKYSFYTKFKTCFQLDPPKDDDNQNYWAINIYLQNEKDDNLIIPASDIWKYQTNTIGFFEQRFENPQERLLIDLGTAEQIYPKINECLQSIFPSIIPLTQNEAFEFLTSYIKPLEELGFKVFLPSWWYEPEKEMILELELENKETDCKNNSQSLFSLNKLVDFNWKFSIGDQILSVEEFEQLASLRVPFVQLRGKWIKINQNDIERTIQFFKEKYLKLTYRDILEMDALLTEENTFLPTITLPQDYPPYNPFNQIIKNSKIEILMQPDSFVGELRPYQLLGYSWLDYLSKIGFGVCLADDMGLGKTIQIIALLLKKKEENNLENPALLICPTSILGNWFKELEKFGPLLKTFIHHGSKRPSEEDFESTIKDFDVILTTYNLVQRDFQNLSKLNWSIIILDESHNIKNSNTKQSRAIRKLKGQSRIALTGTPIENRLTELWSMMDFLNPGYLGSKNQFYNNYVEAIEKGNNTQKVRILSKLIQPFILRRLKTDPNIIKDLPEKVENKVYCSLSEEQALLYEAVVRNLLERIEVVDGMERKGMILSSLTKLKQICNHPAHFLHDYSEAFEDRSGKINLLVDMLEEILANNEKALIFTQFAEFGRELCIYLENVFNQEILFLHGSLSQKERDILVQRFQDESKVSPNIFILSIKAGGVGLNLTAANHVFHIDRWWNPSVENQATDRAYRIGQNKNVFVYKFINIGTMEENIDKLIERKMNLADSIISSGESWITELSTDDLRQLLSLKSIMDRS
ncbi:MAG: DEAD/DEAH box helicase [Candidatus Heimdallarchaeota archaeon]|nr:DEAD/DEAH box helicase [Candidatus Heimdallarchaeota archaeon]